MVAQIIEEGDKAGWIEHVQELPLDEKMKKAGFGQPTPVNETAVIGTNTFELVRGLDAHNRVEDTDMAFERR